MKRRLFVVLLAVVATFSAFAFTACKKDKNDGDEILISSFEDYDELTSMRWLNQFGAAELSDERVTHGNKSLHVSAMGKVGVAAKPVMCIETKTDRLKKFDFTDVDKFMLDVYNDNDYDANVYFQYLTAAANQNKTSGEIKATVPAKTAKTVEFVVDRELSAYFLNLDDVLQIRIAFDPISEIGDAYRSFYIDNLRCHTTSEKFTPVNPREADEIESADRSEYLASWGNILAYVFSPSSLTFNSDPAYIKDGDGSFKLTSERTGGSATDMYTIGIACINNPIPDFTQYAALGYWVYNANDTAIDAYLTGNYFMGKLKPNEWTYLEVSRAMLKEAQNGNPEADDAESLDNFGPMFSVPSDKNYTFYIDEMYAIKDGLEPIITVEDFEAEYPETGTEITVPKATVKYADDYSVKVYKPNGDLLGEDLESFTADQYGFYEIVYTATARRANADGVKATAEERIRIAIGSLPKFKTLPKNVYLTDTDEYSLVLPECDNGTVSWKAEVVNVYYPSYVALGAINPVNTDGYTGGVKEGTGADTVKVYDGTAVRVTYTATNDQGLSAVATQTVFGHKEARLAETYPDMYADGTVSGDLTVVSDTESIFGESAGLRLKDEFGSAAGTFTPSSDLYLGVSNSNLRFVVYNSGTRPVVLLVNGNGQSDKTLLPGNYLVFNGVMFGYEAALQGWQIISQDKHLLPITFSASSDAEVDLFIGRFTINADSFAPKVNISDIGRVDAGTELDLNDYITVQGADKKFTYTVSYSATENGSFVQKQNGNEQSAAFTPTKSGWYLVDVTVSYGDDGTVKVSKKFQASARELTFTNVPKDAFAAADTSYTITPPDCENANVTWKTEYFAINFFGPADNMYSYLRTDLAGQEGSGSGSAYIYGGLALRITYTATDTEDAANVKTVYQTVINFTDAALLSEVYDNFYTDATATGDLTKLGDNEMFGDGGFVLASDTAQESGEFRYRASGDFTPAENAKYLGGSNGNVHFIVYNDGNDSIKFSGNRFGGNVLGAPGPEGQPPKPILPHTSAVFNGGIHGYSAALIGWGVVTDGNLNSFNFIAESNSPVKVRIGYFTVNDDSFEPKTNSSVSASYSAGASVDFAELLSVTGGNGFEYVVKKGETQIASGTNESHSAVTLSDVGGYDVTYTVHYKKGAQNLTKTVTASFTVNSFTVDLGANKVKRIGVGTYDLEANQPNLDSGLTVTDWKVEWYDCTLWGGCKPELTQIVADKSVTSFTAEENKAYIVTYTISNGGGTTFATQSLLPETGASLNDEPLFASAFEQSAWVPTRANTVIEIGGSGGPTDKTVVMSSTDAVGGQLAPTGAALPESTSGFAFWIMVESESDSTVSMALKGHGALSGVVVGRWFRLDFRPADRWNTAWHIIDVANGNLFTDYDLSASGTGRLTLYVDMFVNFPKA